MLRIALVNVVLCAAVLIPAAFGQTAGSIDGLVTDSTGSVVVGAKVTVSNPQTNFSRDAVSNSAGDYRFPDLAPGVYNITAEMQGFQTEIRKGVELQVQQAARIDFQLNIGAVNQTVEVAGGAPLLDTENATVGTVIDTKKIVDLPLNGRSFVSLIALSSNVTTGQTANSGWSSTRGDPGRGAVSISIAGMRREYMYYTLDGLSDSDVDFNTYTLLPSIDALQEFKIQTGIYSAEFGRESAQVNISTLSGTNEYHGTVFEFLRNNALDARPYGFTTNVPVSAPLKWNQFGFMLGGPVSIPKVFNGKNRLFFMSNYEGFRFSAQPQNVYSTPPTAMRTGDFSQLLPTIAIKDPRTGQPFSGNIIPNERLSTVSLGLLNQFAPAANVPGAGLANNYLAVFNEHNPKDQFTQRIDFVESAKSSWFGRYSWQSDTLNNVGPYLTSTTLLVGGVATSALINTGVHQALISNSRILSPSLVNQFTFGYAGFNDNILTQSANKVDVTGNAGINLFVPAPPVEWGVPTVAIPGFSGYGDNYNAPYVLHDHTFQWSDGLSWTHGKHAVKVGVEIRRDRYNSVGGQLGRGQFGTGNTATGYGFANYALGLLDTFAQTTHLGYSQFRATTQAYYFNDNWKISRNLTLEAGIRYEYTPPWQSKGDNVANLVFPFDPTQQWPGGGVPGSPIPANLTPYMAVNCAAYGRTTFNTPTYFNVYFDPRIPQKCVNGPGTTIVADDKTNWAPRVGLAWNPRPNWTVRTGVGIFYVVDQGDTYFDEALNLAGKGQAAATNLANPNLTWSQPFPLGAANLCNVAVPPNVCISTPVVLGNQTNHRTPYVLQYNFNIQRQLTSSMVLEVGYIGSQGNRLPRPLGENEAYPSAVGSVLSRQPFPQYGSLQETFWIDSSNYNAGSVKLTRRLAAGFTFTAGYTFSKSIDDGSGVRAENGSSTTQPQTGWCVVCERGLSDFDSRHRVVISGLYTLPVGKGQRFLNHGAASVLLGGWQVNSVFSKSSGFPGMVLLGVNRSNTKFGGNNRPNAVPGVNANDGPKTTQEWFNIDAFQEQPLGSYGNVGRNTVIGPGIAAWDFSAFKNFAFTERRQLQFRFECFNCANHPAFGDPGYTVTGSLLNANGNPIPGTGSFGTITSTRPGIDMRELQFALKLQF
jgi:hypothetical protein